MVAPTIGHYRLCVRWMDQREICGSYYLAFLLEVDLWMVRWEDIVSGSDYGASHF